VHVFLHIIENVEPERDEGREGEQGREMVQENLAEDGGSTHAGLLDDGGVRRAEGLQEASQQGEQHVTEARLPLGRRQRLEVVDEQSPRQVRHGSGANLHNKPNSVSGHSTAYEFPRRD